MSVKESYYFPATDHIEKGHFQDVSRFRKVIGSTEWDSLRYFETAVEMLEPGKYSHRNVLVTETCLYIFALSANPKKPVHTPIPFKNVISITSNSSGMDIFSEPELNKHLRPIKIEFFVSSKTSTRNTVEIVSWEKYSCLFFHVESAWNNLLIRLCLGFDITMKSNTEESGEAVIKLFQDITFEIEYSQTIEKRCSLLQELSSASLDDRELKECFFKMPRLRDFILRELTICKQGSAAVFMNNNHPVSQKDHQNMLYYVTCLLNVFQSMLFNSETISSRIQLLNAPQFSFNEIAVTLTHDYSFALIQRSRQQLVHRNDEEETDASSVSDESDSDNGYLSEDAIDQSENVFLLQILEVQVTILLDLASIINLAIASGTSSTLVSNTLGRILAKSGHRFLCHWLPKFTKQLVRLLNEWIAMLPGKQKELNKDEVEHQNFLSVKIFQHAKLLQQLVLADYNIRESLLLFNEEEIQYYLSKQDFLNKVLCGNIQLRSRLNKQAVSSINITNQAFEDLRKNITKPGTNM